MSTSTTPDYSKLYRLSDPLANRPLRLESEGWATVDRAWNLFRGTWRPTEPLRLRAYMGGHPSDFLWTGFPPIVCISQRVVDLLVAHQVTGWSTYQVEVYGRKGERLPGYHGFSITGPECERDKHRSPIVDALSPAGVPIRVSKGLYFDERQWDGSDCFLVNGFKVVTEKVYRLCKRAKVTNVMFTRLTEFEDVIRDED